MAGDHDCSSSGLDNGLGGQKQEMMAVDHDFSSSWIDKGLGGQKQDVMSGDHNCSSSGLDKGLGGQKQEVMVGDHDCSSSWLDEGLGGQKKEVMVGDHDCSSSGLDKVPSGIGQVADFLSAARELRKRKSQNDVATSSTGKRTYCSTAPKELWAEPLSKDLQGATTSSTGGFTYYSTAPKELWTEVLSKDLHDLNLGAQNNEGESSCVEVLLLEPSDLVFGVKLAEGGQASIYSATCPKFPMPVVVKRLNNVNVDLLSLQRRMDRVMKIRKKNNSAICKVLGVGKDMDGKVCVVMEQMRGDLRTLINVRHDGCIPLGYNEIVAMMLEVAQGMEDLHGCNLIHADLKASNILVCTEQDLEGGKVERGDEKKIQMYFRVKIADFDTSDGIWGTGFWRAPEVLQALLSGAKTPTLSPAADVYSYGMLCYELLTGEIPFDKVCGRSEYEVAISGRRPQLPAYLHPRMKELMSSCWHANPQNRPGWTRIIEILKKERRRCPLLSCDWEKVDIAFGRSFLPNQIRWNTMWCKRRFDSSLIGMVEMQVERDLEMQRIKNDDDDSHVDDFHSHEADDDDNMSQPLDLQF
ncbi:unnamed protein product [Sphagnum troendelagicum]|uniref:Protein kinase domain-containing protein n=1 Tax=Sphagnum troendelagicum TaxID=128251 RepID=A0ABP0TSG2_9BRYO